MKFIKSDQTYLKFFTDKDGLYQITFEDLTKAGVPLASIRGSQLQVWRLGVERPLWISNAGGIITETEAYSEIEKGCHAYNKRKTERTKPPVVCRRICRTEWF